MSNTKMLELGYTEKHINLLAVAYLSTKDGVIDWDKFLTLSGYGTKGSAQTTFRAVKRELAAIEAKSGSDTDTTPKKADAAGMVDDASTGTAKRKGNGDGDGDKKEKPAKKPRAARAKKQAKKVEEAKKPSGGEEDNGVEEKSETKDVELTAGKEGETDTVAIKSELKETDEDDA